jgi:hypothetical protein
MFGNSLKLKSILAICLLIHCGSGIILSQSAAFFAGKVIDSKSSEPVPFATIMLKNNQLGVYANAEGDFKIPQNPDFKSDSLIVTCIGYKRYSTAYSLLSQKINVIHLEPVIYGLSEVTVKAGRKIGSITIVRKAIGNIAKNYPAKPFSYISYYRDYQKSENNYFNLNEGIVQTLDNGFTDTARSNKYRLLDFRKNTDFRRMTMTPFYEQIITENQGYDEKSIPDATLGDQFGNELLILMVHDAIRNYQVRSFSFIETLSKNFILNHNFSPPEIVFNDNLALYKIAFIGKTRVTGDKLSVKGAIYIEPKNYSIHKIEYYCYYRPGSGRTGEMFSANIEYGRANDVDSLMCLKYISFNNYFKVTDVTDESYFRAIKAALDTSSYINPTLILEFNKKVDPVSGSKKENYEFRVAKKHMNITRIQVNGNLVYIRIKTEDYKKNKGSSFTIAPHNIKDSEGTLMDKRKSMDVYQYRELFVQQYNKPVVSNDSCFIQYKPLEDNCISDITGKEKYWMNTPAQINK